MTSIERGEEEEDPDDHVATIAGRKMISGSCHYLLRNSYGTDACSRYKRRFRSNCSKGDLWISEKDLAPTMSAITYIQ